ncbi:hypothetical protein NP233_g11748 [Leucocoprinus birnbaumii]|uniref:Copia protein n=1 Tax=Leucocoprinus birnbaumii TaxID=56174 RepID=A0AAD5VIE9_9AGAR|nr:hypothetical protein NP233_g11748 [Leucocoprinus birnbaumii]
MWLSSFFNQASLPQNRPVSLFIDNNGAIDMTKTYRGHKHTKHIDIRHHFVKEKVEMGEFTPIYIPSEDNIADLLTKPLPRDATRNFTADLGLWDLGNESQMK